MVSGSAATSKGSSSSVASTSKSKSLFAQAKQTAADKLIAVGDRGPTWAPNGRVLMYFKQDAPVDNGKSSNVNLYKIDITGFREMRILTPSDGSDPAWSPLLPN